MSTVENISRREMLEWSTWGLTGAALTSLVHAGSNPEVSHFPAPAKRVVHVVLMGGLSHIDSFDYKPDLEKFHGKPLQYKERPATFFNQIGLIRKNDWVMVGFRYDRELDNDLKDRKSGSRGYTI